MIMEFIYSTSTSFLLVFLFSVFLFLFFSKIKNNKQQISHPSTLHLAESSSSSQPISTTIQPKYDVFLSFRGEDVRNNFVSHLKVALHRNGIKSFIDDEIVRGEEISPSLLKAIEQSLISIIVFSKNYASSKWCLSELLKILECRTLCQQIVMPIFYYVDPSHVRKQEGSYGEAFEQHEKTLKDGKHNIQRWKDALTEATNMSGWDLQNGDEAAFIDKLTNDILEKLNRRTSFDIDGLVGIETRVESIVSSLNVGSTDVRFLGIWGMGGIGKTTIAEVLFHKIKCQFDGWCFLENIREDKKNHGVKYLQKKILSKVLQERHFSSMDISNGFYKNRLCGKKVLIVLDDINDMEQLEGLSGARDWFGSGSRIIITTRDRQVLSRADKICEAKHLIYEEAMLLFCHHAFGKNHPLEDYLDLSRKAVNYADGIPLALKVLGSSLCGKNKQTWESTLAKLERVPNEKVDRVLKLSYEDLDDMSKKILLDVACFFKGDNVDDARAIWDGCGFFPDTCISVLEDRCLLEIRDHSKLWMHDLIEHMCKAIVDKENIDEPGKRSRLWRHEDIFYMFKKNAASEAIECIILDLSKAKEVIELCEDAFKNMTNLRLLKLFSSRSCESMKITLPHGLTMFPDTLRYLYWHGYPYEFLPSNFDPRNLVQLSLPHSCIRRLWKEHKVLKILKSIDLSYCSYLFEVPDLSEAPSLEDINLESCTGLSTIHPSIFTLTKLIHLDLAYCWNLQNLPGTDRSNLQNIPDNICNLNSLENLSLFYCSNLQNIPDSIGNLKSLKILNLFHCSNLQKISDSICHLKSLKILNLGGCSNLQNIPDDIGNLKSLKWMNLLNCSNLQNIPDSICNLNSLEIYSLSGCSNLQNIPDGIYNLKSHKSLDLSGCSNLQNIPDSICNLKSLESLNFSGCSNLQNIPDSICNLKSLDFSNLSGCSNLQNILDSICNLKSLESLSLSGCSNLQNIPDSICNLKSLKSLNLSDCSNLQNIPDSICNLKSLKSLNLSNCSNLQNIPDSICNLNSLELLNLSCCSNLQNISDSICNLKSLKWLNLSCCSNLQNIPDSICNLKSLWMLNLSNCSNLQNIPDNICNLKSLWMLNLSGCSNLQNIPDNICNLISLWMLDLSSCSNLLNIPDNICNLISL